jgi:hypothetical protein
VSFLPKIETDMKLTKVRAPTHETTERAWWVEGSDHLRPQKPREKPRAVASLAETSRHRLTSVCADVCVCVRVCGCVGYIFHEKQQQK